LTGQDIQRERPDIQPGPEFGKIIKNILEQQKGGQIKTKEEALERLRKLRNFPQ
jgi:hypothetical protein